MKTGVLMLWSGCLVSIALSLIHFAWFATSLERITLLAALLLAAGNLRRRS